MFKGMLKAPSLDGDYTALKVGLPLSLEKVGLGGVSGLGN